MAAVTLTDELRAQLNGFTEPVPVCEPDGKVVGHILPEDQYLKYLYTLAQTAVTREELDAAAQQTGGRTLADIRRERLGGA